MKVVVLAALAIFVMWVFVEQDRYARDCGPVRAAQDLSELYGE